MLSDLRVPHKEKVSYVLFSKILNVSPIDWTEGR
jgi:hypothetical protein